MLFHLFEIDEPTQPLYNAEGHEAGKLMIEMVPEPETDKDFDSMDDIIGAPVDLKVSIKEAAELLKQHENLYVTYSLSFIGGDLVKVASQGITNRPQFGYSAVHKFHITAGIAQHF